MLTRNRQNIDGLEQRIDGLPLLSPEQYARVFPLYVKIRNNNGVVNNVSLAYIDGYDGATVFQKFRRYFEQLHEMFLRNALDESERRVIFKRVASGMGRFPTTVKGMKFLVGNIMQATHAYIKTRRLREARAGLFEKFKNAIKKYLHLTYSLGFNVPSECAMHLISTHRIDKHIMSGEFPVILLPFLPEIESAIKKAYEHSEMKDAWEVLRGRYFNHRDEWSTIAIEVKNILPTTIGNFSDYFDKIYTDTYYKLMLERQQRT